MDIFDIARLAGVSRKTVQRVLNNAPNVRPATRENIMRIMEQHDYEPNAAARKLATRKANTIGLFIVQDERFYRLYPDDPYYGAVIGAIISACSERGYHTLVSIHDIARVEPILSLYRQKNIDGGILISWSNVQAVANRVLQAGHLIGAFDPSNGPDMQAACMVPQLDNRKGAYIAAKALIDGGHRDIGIIAGNPNNPAAHERLQGYLEAAREHGIELQESKVRTGLFTEESGDAAIRSWVQDGTLPRAILCSNDAMAYGALEALRRLGIRVPEEVSVIGFDDLPRSQYCWPPLTTMRIPRVEMAVQLAESLLARIELDGDGAAAGRTHRRVTAVHHASSIAGGPPRGSGSHLAAGRSFEPELVVRGTCTFGD